MSRSYCKSFFQKSIFILVILFVGQSIAFTQTPTASTVGERLERVKNIALYKDLSRKCYLAGKKKYEKDREKAALFVEKCRSKYINKPINKEQTTIQNIIKAIEEEEAKLNKEKDAGNE